MPPAAIGATFVAMGASAATAAAVTTFVTAVYVGAAVGAVIGAGTALVTGGDVMDGAIRGAVIGGLTKGVMSGISQMSSAGAGVAKVGEAGMATQGAAGAAQAMPTTGMGAGAADAAGNVSAAGVGSIPAQQVTQQAVSQPGFLDKAIGFIEANPKTSEIIAGGVSGAAKAIAEKRARQQELEAQMERDRLLIDSRKVRGLENINIGSAIPSVGGFLERPKWRLEDLTMAAR